MGLRIYNSLTRKKEDFEPVSSGKVGMYVCGVTVYDMCHIGHARSLVLFDVIFRYLKHVGYDVTYVRNFTDVDDKIIKRANERGENWKELAERFVEEFYVDMDALGLLRPTYEPRATEHIAQIQSLIGKLVERKYAYVIDGDVMFSVESFTGYGKLSGKRTEDLMAGARIDVNDKKRNPLDFALWKAAKPGEPYWESPWGPGRPGWHIECSAMSMEYLGETFDIHGGGADLAFPHHENEIAQSQGATGAPFAKYWVHNGFVNIRAEKMAKSLGNVINIRDILATVHPEALRIFLLSSHYRSPLDYNETSIKEASRGLERLYAALGTLRDLLEAGGTSTNMPQELTDLREKFSDAMDDDFNTPRCLAALFDAARAINRIEADGASPERLPERGLLSQAMDDLLTRARDILGLLNDDPGEFMASVRHGGVEDLGIGEREIHDLIALRAEARKHKDFKRADEIRSQLASKGILLEDTPQGTVWKVREE